MLRPLRFRESKTPQKVFLQALQPSRMSIYNIDDFQSFCPCQECSSLVQVTQCTSKLNILKIKPSISKKLSVEISRL